MLTSYEKGSDRYEYSYNEDGLRVEKKYYSNNTLNDVCTYVWENGKLIAQKKYVCQNDDYLTITYLYDGEEAIGFVYDGLTFYYIKNIQGDVTAIAIADSGKLALTISYDAWGNPEYSIVVDDNAGVWEKLAAFLRAAGIMGLNNYTYRGYFYDTETGLYYLQSRYYDPKVGRFINLDETSIAAATTGEIFGVNLFAYCGNNPVNNNDSYGFWFSPIYSQYDSAVADLKVGSKPCYIKNVGCELVAIYNAMLYLNKADSLKNIIKYAENNHMLYLQSGVLGTNPAKIYKYLKYRNVKYSICDEPRIFFSCLMNNYYGIITFTNKNFLKNGIHTFFLFYDKNNKEYVVFNGYDAKITSAKRYKNISDVSKNGGSSYFYGILFKK